MATEIRDASGALIGHQLEHTAQQVDDAVEGVDDLTHRVTELENSGGGSGLTDDARTLLLTILRNAVFTSNQTGNIEALNEALNTDGGSDSPDTPDEPTESDEISVKNGVMTILSLANAPTVANGIMTIA